MCEALKPVQQHFDKVEKRLDGMETRLDCRIDSLRDDPFKEMGTPDVSLDRRTDTTGSNIQNQITRCKNGIAGRRVALLDTRQVHFTGADCSPSAAFRLFGRKESDG